METIGGKKFKVGGRRRVAGRSLRAPPTSTSSSPCVSSRSGHCDHGRRQAVRRLPQLPPHLRDLRGQTHRGKRSSHEPAKGPRRGHPELLASYDIKA